jgi:ankyrin repeat protein
MACHLNHWDIIEFLLGHNADINKQEKKKRMTPLHAAIFENKLAACQLILEYEHVSSQSIESGITMSRISNSPEIRALLVKKLKCRRKVILVCFLLLLTFLMRALDTELAQKICCFCKEVPQKRKKCARCKIAVYCSAVCV